MPGTIQPARVGKRPMRSCVGCRTVRDKRELIRIVRTAEESVRLDPTGKVSGRGAYLCPSVQCLRQAVKRRSLPRALKREISAERLAELEQEFLAIIGTAQPGEESRLP